MKTEGSLDINEELNSEENKPQDEPKQKTQKEMKEAPLTDKQEFENVKKSYTSVIIIVVGIIVIFAFVLGLSLIFGGNKEENVVDGVIFDGSETDITDGYSYEYRGFKFARLNNVWLAKIDVKIDNRSLEVYDFAIRYSPKELEDITIQPGVQERILNSGFVYYTTDPKLSSKAVVAIIEVGRAIGDKYNIFNKPSKSGLTKEVEESNVTAITCQDATDNVVVMYFKLGEKTGVRSEGNCILVEGETEWDIIRSSDRLLYQLLNIMD